MMRIGIQSQTAFLLLWIAPAGAAEISKPAAVGGEHPLLAVMRDELALSMESLVSPQGVRPYFLQYTITDQKAMNLTATLGAVAVDAVRHARSLDVDLRCGDYVLDNTRQIRGEEGGSTYYLDTSHWASLPLHDEPLATRQNLWVVTHEEFKDAVERLAQVQANLKLKVEEEDPSDDFTRESAVVSIEPWIEWKMEDADLADRVRRWSSRFRGHPKVFGSSISITGEVENRLVVNSEGTQLQFGSVRWRIGIQASTIADDGMELWQFQAFDAHALSRLPPDPVVEQAIDQVIADVLALRQAPIVEPYTGPAILMNRASGVFFHEIFGHRIEGHRQKDVEEGQTFAKKIGQPVLPEFLSIVDDPSRKEFQGIDLNGHYPFDDEGVRGQPARLVEEGILQSFLLSRLPTREFTKSNGHGRREPGNRVVARQGNLFVESAKQVTYPALRARLIEECRKQNKEFGLLFKDISGGFTTTQRGSPQAFKVLPILVYRVYVDGRPDELVRGVDIVGTPLTCFSRILATADDPAVFNGTCGAESGMVPVSAVSPSILVEQIEIEKKPKAQNRPPFLPAPIDRKE
jgi:predicted Zn-dependent protease